MYKNYGHVWFMPHPILLKKKTIKDSASLVKGNAESFTMYVVFIMSKSIRHMQRVRCEVEYLCCSGECSQEVSVIFFFKLEAMP